MARQESDLKGAVSFHGNLMTGVKPKNNKVKILVCNGANDTFVSPAEIAAFKKEMDSAKINYTFIDYPNSLHSFTLSLIHISFHQVDENQTRRSHFR